MMMSENPLVSVIMPVYNSEKFLREAVESILDQTFTDFELIAINDGSTDDSGSILADYRQRDERMVILGHLKNQGIVSALNWGLIVGRGKYIAYMHADDISHPGRFEKQVAFLETHPEVGILGSAVELIDTRGQAIGVLPKRCDDLAIRWTSLFSSPFMHPTVMLRHSILEAHHLQYQEGMGGVEDLDLWVRLLVYTQAANLAEALLRYRVHPASITSLYNRKDQLNIKSKILFTYAQKQLGGFLLTREQIELVSEAVMGNPDISRERAYAADIYLQTWQAFVKVHQSNPGLNSLQTDIVMTTAKLVLYPPFQSGWRKVMRQLFEIEPHWYVTFICKFPEMVWTKIHSQLIRRNRK